MSQVKLLYDKDCPFCERYSQYVELRKLHDIELLNAREQPELIEELREKGFDIDRGMILLVDKEVFHGKDAVLKLNSMTGKKGLFDTLGRCITSIPGVMTVVYPVLKSVRWVSLKVMGIDTRVTFKNNKKDSN